MKNNSILFEIGTWIKHDTIYIISFSQSIKFMETEFIQDLMKIKSCAIFLKFNFEFFPNFANNLHFVVNTCARFFTLNHTYEVSPSRQDTFGLR